MNLPDSPHKSCTQAVAFEELGAYIAKSKANVCHDF